MLMPKGEEKIGLRLKEGEWQKKLHSGLEAWPEDKGWRNGSAKETLSSLTLDRETPLIL